VDYHVNDDDHAQRIRQRLNNPFGETVSVAACSPVATP
jgi:hypothetical protein